MVDSSSRTESLTYRSTPDFSTAYVRLRTVLDAMQISMIRYCLEVDGARGRIKRIREVEKTIMPLIREIQSKLAIAPGGGGGGGCPDGYFDCGGVCVPYQCPKDS